MYNDDDDTRTDDETQRDDKRQPATWADDAAPRVTEKLSWHKDKKKLVPILLAVIIACLGIGAGWWLQAMNTSDAESSQAQSVTDTSKEQQIVPSPTGVIYAVTTDDVKDPKSYCTPLHTKLYRRAIDKDAGVEAADLGVGNEIGHYGVQENKAFIVTHPSCGSEEGVAVWYSSDGGSSYEKVFNGRSQNADGTVYEQITSAKFSSDGESILVAFLPSVGGINTVKEIDLKTKTADDLFTVDKPGVFLVGYDRAKRQTYYYKGCYNCDGNRHDTLYVHNETADSDEVMFEDTEYVGTDTIANADMSKLLMARIIFKDDMSAAETNFLSEFTISDKSLKRLLTVNGGTSYINAGYRQDDGSVYYSLGNGIYSLGENGEKAVMYESAKPVMKAWFVGKDIILASVGDYSTGSLVSYVPGTKTTKELLLISEGTRVIGASWQ